MTRHMSLRLFLLGALLLSLFCLGCSSGDDGDSDGDAPDGDVPTDGDADGDVPDGDVPDGDDPADGDTGRCNPGEEGLCFNVLSGDRAGEYLYVKHSAFPSGCSITGEKLGVQYFDGASGWSTFSVLVDNYDSPREYNQSVDEVTLQWSIQIGEGDAVEYLNYLSMLPCKVRVQNALEGTFECKLYDNNDAGVAFDVRGVWRCR